MGNPNFEGRFVAPREQAPPPVERRGAVRTLLRGVGGSMGWHGAAGEVTFEVVVLNISGGGAAVLADDSPQAGGAVSLRLRCESAAMEPVRGRVIEVRLDPSGRRVVHVRFDRLVPLDASKRLEK